MEYKDCKKLVPGQRVEFVWDRTSFYSGTVVLNTGDVLIFVGVKRFTVRAGSVWYVHCKTLEGAEVLVWPQWIRPLLPHLEAEFELVE